MRKANYFYFISYVGAVCSHFPKRPTHKVMLLLVCNISSFFRLGRPVTYIQFGSHLPKKYKIRIHCEPNKQCAFNGDLKSDYVFKQIKPALGSELVQPQFREKSSSFESAKFPKHYLMLTKEGGRMKIFLRKVDMSSKKQSKILLSQIDRI